jgi:hypothetical protein
LRPPAVWVALPWYTWAREPIVILYEAGFYFY